MTNINLHRINNSRFSIRLCCIAQDMGIKTFGKMKRFCLENKIVPRGRYMFRNTARLLKELEEYESEIDRLSRSGVL